MSGRPHYPERCTHDDENCKSQMWRDTLALFPRGPHGAFQIAPCEGQRLRTALFERHAHGHPATYSDPRPFASESGTWTKT